MTMRGQATKKHLGAAALAAVAIFLGSATAGMAQSPQQVEGFYATTFEPVSNNCRNTGVNLTTADVELDSVKGRSISMTIPMLPILRGSYRKGGKFRAKAKKGKTAIAGVDGRFSAGGTADGTTIEFVFIAEYFQGKAPLCTQSWNAKGTKKASKAKKKSSSF